MYCANCGKNNRDTETFCAHCGAALPSVVAQKDVQDAVDAYENEAAPETESAGSKNVVTTILIIVLSVFLLGALIGLGFLAKDWFDSNETEQDKAPEPSYTQPVSQEGMTEANPYYACYKAYESYVLPESSTSYITRAQLEAMSQEELTIALQEIYARHGRVFSDTDLQTYFDSRSWYSAGGVTELNTYEKANVILLDVFITQQGGTYSQPGNPYLGLTSGTSSYLLNGSQNRYLEASDLKDLTEKELILARNEIYARHGYVFSDEDLQTYFCTKSWYTPAGTIVSETSLNEYESNNIKLVQIYERRLDGIDFDYENRYMEFYSSTRDYIVPNSSYRTVSDSELANLKQFECAIARNEIFARHGYAFADEELLDYFLMHDWYNPGGKIGDSSKIDLSSTEKENVEILGAAEDVLEDMPENLHNLNHNLSSTVTYDAFSIQIPSYWSDYAVNKSSDMKFCEKVTYDNTDRDGMLFYFSIVPMDQEPAAASYRMVGILTDSNGVQYKLVAVYPSDVRYHICARGLYQAMSGDIDRILNSVTAVNGYTFTAY